MDSQKIENLLHSANSCLLSFEVGPEIFLEKVSNYLDELDSWKSNVSEKEVAAATDEIKNKIRTLLELHQQVLDKSNLLKTDVAQGIGELSKKTNMLKAYLDHAPGRVTIAGTRKG